jgi:hypothetical protein
MRLPHEFDEREYVAERGYTLAPPGLFALLIFLPAEDPVCASTVGHIKNVTLADREYKNYAPRRTDEFFAQGLLTVLFV